MSLGQHFKEFWKEIDKYPPHAPPGTETGGQLAFMIWFCGFAIMCIVYLGPLMI